LEDRNGAFTQLHARTSQMFFAELPSLRLRTLALFRRQLDWIRFSVDRDLGVSYQLLKSEFIQYYFQLIFLYDDEPYAYTKWMKPLLKRLPSYALFPPNLEREISSFLLKATAREALSHADNLVEVLFNRLRRAGKCHQPDLLDVDSDAYYSLLP
jgi:hypothetical protein